jgi:hypothetical protein
MTAFRSKIYELINEMREYFPIHQRKWMEKSKNSNQG